MAKYYILHEEYDYAQDHRNFDKIIIEKSFLMLGSKAIGMFVKVDGLEALLKDMEEEFMFNSVLSWKLFQKDI